MEDVKRTIEKLQDLLNFDLIQNVESLQDEIKNMEDALERKTSRIEELEGRIEDLKSEQVI